MTRTILITGGAGYIGSRLIRDLANDPDFADCTLRIYDNLQRETYTSLLDLPLGDTADDLLFGPGVPAPTDHFIHLLHGRQAGPKAEQFLAPHHLGTFFLL